MLGLDDLQACLDGVASGCTWLAIGLVPGAGKGAKALKYGDDIADAAFTGSKMVSGNGKWIPVDRFVRELKQEIRDLFRGDGSVPSGEPGKGALASAALLDRYLKENTHLFPEVIDDLQRTAAEWRRHGAKTNHPGGPR